MMKPILLAAATLAVAAATPASAQRITDYQYSGVRAGQNTGGYYGGYGYGYGGPIYYARPAYRQVYARPYPGRVYYAAPYAGRRFYGGPVAYGYGGPYGYRSGYDPASVQGGGRTQGSDAFVPPYQRGSGQRAGGPAYQLNYGY